MIDVALESGLGVRHRGIRMGPVIALTTMSVYPAVGLVRDATGSYAAVFQGDLVALALAVALVIPLQEGRA